MMRYGSSTSHMKFNRLQELPVFTDVKAIYKGMQQKPVQRLYCRSTTDSVYEKYFKIPVVKFLITRGDQKVLGLT